jgi:hypothetical protein
MIQSNKLKDIDYNYLMPFIGIVNNLKGDKGFENENTMNIPDINDICK